MEQFLAVLNVLQNETAQLPRKNAEASFENAVKTSPNDVVSLLIQVLESTSAQAMAGHDMAGVLLRRQLSKDTEDSLWRRCDDAHKGMICSKILQFFETAMPPTKAVAECIPTLVQLLCDKTPFWPDLLPTIMRMAGGDVATKVRALKVLPEIVEYEPIKNVLTANRDGTMKLLAQALQDHNNPSVQVQGICVVCAIVIHWTKKEWAPYQDSIGPMLNICENFAKTGKMDELGTILQAFNSVAEEKSLFFRNEMNRVTQTFCQFCNAKNFVTDDMRQSALEFLLTLSDFKPDMCMKQCPQFAELVLHVCMEFMTEIDDCPKWATRMDDEEDDKDDETVDDGASGVDRLVQNVTVDRCQQTLVQAISTYVNKDSWQCKFAALTAIRQAIEYVQDDSVVDQMTGLLAEHTKHPHMRIRYAAWHALSQAASDQQPRFQECWHQALMPLLANAMDDPEKRVQQIALTFFVSFGEALDNTNMELYQCVMMDKLVKKIKDNSNPHRGVREEAVTSIAVIAGVVEKDFEQYYDGVMPMLQEFIVNSTGEADSRLRGKAFECMSLLGMAVGKQRFHLDAQKAVEAMMRASQTLESTSIQVEYIHEAVIRICRCLKKDFKPLLQYCLPPVYSVLKLERIDKDEALTSVDNMDEELVVEHGGRQIKVKTAKMDELANNMNQLLAFIEEMQEEFYPEVANCAKLLLPFVVEPVSLYYAAEEARASAFQCWAQLITSCMKSNAPDALNLAGDLLRKVCGGVYTFFGKYEPDEIEELKINACGLGRCLKAAEARILTGNDLKSMFTLPMRLLKLTFDQRAKNLENTEVEADDEEADEEGDEHEALVQLGELLGALMYSNPDVFTEMALTEVGELLKMLFESTHPKTKDEDLTLAIYITCSLIEHLKQRSVSGWPLFMPKVLNGLHHQVADIRQTSAYAINLASSIPDFAQYVNTAVERIGQCLRDEKKFRKKHDDLSKEAIDNMVSALLQICLHQTVSPGTVELVYNKLPLRDDIQEGEKIHAQLLQLVKASNPIVLGPNNEHFGTLIGKFAEIYGSESSNDELNMDIRTTFDSIPKDTLAKVEQSFTQKQIKKIQRILKDLN